MNRQPRNKQDRRGAMLPLTAVMSIVLLGMVGLSVDVGYLCALKTRLQATADAAALAAVGDVSNQSAATATAQHYADLNHGGHGNVLKSENVVLGTWNDTNRTFTPGASGANGVKVTITRTNATGNAVNLFFGPALGIHKSDVSASAIAMSRGSISAFPLALRRPSVGAVKPALPIPLIGPSKPANGSYFTVGEQVVIGYNGNLQWNGQQNWTQISITLLEGSVNATKKIVDGTNEMAGIALPQMPEGTQYTSEPIQNDWIVWAKKRTTYPTHPELLDVVMPVIEELANSRDPSTQLLNGPVQIVDAVAVHIVGWQWENTKNTVTGKTGKAQALVGTVTGITNKYAPSGTNLGSHITPSELRLVE